MFYLIYTVIKQIIYIYIIINNNNNVILGYIFDSLEVFYNVCAVLVLRMMLSIVAYKSRIGVYYESFCPHLKLPLVRNWPWKRFYVVYLLKIYAK